VPSVCFDIIVLHLHVLLQAFDARIEEVGTLQPQQRLISAICLRHISVNNKLLKPAHLIHPSVCLPQICVFLHDPRIPRAKLLLLGPPLEHELQEALI
jgi:hypothetical protein